LEIAAAELGEFETCAGHGSYSYAQILIAPDRVVTVDWDGYDLADPSRDVARFTVALQRLALGRLGSLHALDEFACAFVETYTATRGTEIAQRLPFYQAAICLQLAKYDVHHQVRHWREKIAALLDQGLRILDG
jgi:aminoglycoside phosphotransferase (APT) family kinase protein